MLQPTKADKQTKTRIEYVEADLEQVLQYFVNGYKLQSGVITSHKSFVDAAKGRVVFKLFIED